MGSAAKSSSRLCFTLVNVATPAAPRTALPTKFAVAEKHMAGLLRCEHYTTTSQRKTASLRNVLPGLSSQIQRFCPRVPSAKWKDALAVDLQSITYKGDGMRTSHLG